MPYWDVDFFSDDGISLGGRGNFEAATAGEALTAALVKWIAAYKDPALGQQMRDKISTYRVRQQKSQELEHIFSDWNMVFEPGRADRLAAVAIGGAQKMLNADQGD